MGTGLRCGLLRLGAPCSHGGFSSTPITLQAEIPCKTDVAMAVTELGGFDKSRLG